MDPNANLHDQAATTDRAHLRELRIALADWLAAEGFAPTWSAYPQTTRRFRRWVLHHYHATPSARDRVLIATTSAR